MAPGNRPRENLSKRWSSANKRYDLNAMLRKVCVAVRRLRYARFAKFNICAIMIHSTVAQSQSIPTVPAKVSYTNSSQISAIRARVPQEEAIIFRDGFNQHGRVCQPYVVDEPRKACWCDHRTTRKKDILIGTSLSSGCGQPADEADSEMTDYSPIKGTIWEFLATRKIGGP